MCNALWPVDSPCRKVLKQPDSYGHILYDYLGRVIQTDQICSILEIGGGYGYLTKDFLDRNPSLKVTMLDISPVLIDKQRETLAEYQDVTLISGDFLSFNPGDLRGYDLAVMNENLGDFETYVGIDRMIFHTPYKELDGPMKTVRDLCRRYHLMDDASSVFNLNVGAIQSVEKLCTAGISNIFLSEHSCEATIPEPFKPFISFSSQGNPERIVLKGHDEYTIRFSHLEKVARKFRYGVRRGNFADLLAFEFTDRMRYILTSGSASDEHEILRQFSEDLFKYEFLILMKNG